VQPKKYNTQSSEVSVKRRKAVPFSVVEFNNKEEMKAWRRVYDETAERKSLEATKDAKKRAQVAFDNGAGSYSDKSTHEKITAIKTVVYVEPPKPLFTRMKETFYRWCADLWESATRDPQ
jgi:hypothetical protein